MAALKSVRVARPIAVESRGEEPSAPSDGSGFCSIKSGPSSVYPSCPTAHDQNLRLTRSRVAGGYSIVGSVPSQ